jgi:peroxiredoxin
MLPIPATFVLASDGTIAARFIDPDYRKRMTVEDMVKALRNAQDPAGTAEKP